MTIPLPSLLLAVSDPADRRMAVLIAALVILAFWRYCRREMNDSAPKE
ncbi:MAG: hypothetical protein ACHQ5A_02915 [Opitutales bacterium]